MITNKGLAAILVAKLSEEELRVRLNDDKVLYLIAGVWYRWNGVNMIAFDGHPRADVTAADIRAAKLVNDLETPWTNWGVSQESWDLHAPRPKDEEPKKEEPKTVLTGPTNSKVLIAPAKKS